MAHRILPYFSLFRPVFSSPLDCYMVSIDVVVGLFEIGVAFNGSDMMSNDFMHNITVDF